MKRLTKSIFVTGLMMALQPSSAWSQNKMLINDKRAATAEAIDSEKLAAATNLINVIMPPEKRKAMIDAMVSPMMRNVVLVAELDSKVSKLYADDPEYKLIFRRFFDKVENYTLSKLELEMPALTTTMSRAYARQFTLQEMKDATAFFSSPSGIAFSEKSVTLMADPGVRKWQIDMMVGMKEEFDPMIKAFANEAASYEASKKRKKRKK
jgi:hypothetical protein